MPSEYVIQLANLRQVSGKSGDWASGSIAPAIERQLREQNCPPADGQKRFSVSAEIRQARKPSYHGGPVDADNYVRNIVNAINAEKSGWSGPKVLWLDDNQVDIYDIVREFDNAAEDSAVTLRISEIPRRLIGPQPESLPNAVPPW